MLEYLYDTQLLIEGKELDEDEIRDYFIENFKKALEINNRSYLYNEESPCINNLAKTYIKIGKYREAIELYKDFIKKESNGNGLILIPYSLNGIDDYKYLII